MEGSTSVAICPRKEKVIAEIGVRGRNRPRNRGTRSPQGAEEKSQEKETMRFTGRERFLRRKKGVEAVKSEKLWKRGRGRKL